MRLFGEIGDHRGDMRQPLESEKRRPALEVDQRQVQFVGGVRRGQPEDEGPQELGLARPGGANTQAVWAHPTLGRLLDVQIHRRTAVSRPATGSDRHT